MKRARDRKGTLNMGKRIKELRIRREERVGGLNLKKKMG